MRTAYLALLITLALTLAACGADDIPADTPTPPAEEGSIEPPAAEEAASEDPGAEDGAEPEEEASVPAADPDVERAGFESLFSMKSNAQWMVRYTLTTSGLPDTLDGVEMTQYLGGANRLHTDVIAQGAESRTYIIDGTVTICTQVNDAWMCFASEIDSDVQAEIEEDIESGSYDVERTGTRLIAGASATCYAFTTNGGGSGEYCFSSEGVPLFIEASWEDVTTEMVATEYALSVPAGTWDVPESSGLPGGFDPSAWI